MSSISKAVAAKKAAWRENGGIAVNKPAAGGAHRGASA